MLDIQPYAKLRHRVASAAAVTAAAAELRLSAQALCASTAPAVVDKQFTMHSPSRDPRDCVSIATYWWPNPQSADGLPFTSRDGQVSPLTAQYDRPRWERAAAGIVTLTKAAVALDEPAFGQTAATWLRRWFLDPASGMTPHLAYAQMIPGRCTGRQYGIIDFALYLPTVLDVVQLLAARPAYGWTATDQAGLSKWCAELLTWLESHSFGKAEEATTNNHGTWYDVLVVSLALFLNRPERAQAQLVKTQQRIAPQIEPDGTMPRELHRSCSLSYTIMNIRGFVDLAVVGRRIQPDLWAWRDDQGRSIAAAVDNLYGFACGSAPWPHQQIEPVDWRVLPGLFQKARQLAGQGYDVTAMAHRLPNNFVPEAFQLGEPLHPFGKERSPAVAVASPEN